MKTYPILEKEHKINGVNGRMFAIQEPQEIRANLVYRCQKWISEGRKIKGYGTNGIIHVSIRFDDECKNGHQSFAITADVRTDESRRLKDIAAGGCLHDDIEKIFPELKPLIKWHLMNSDGPMYYVANTIYHASNRDCNGLLKGESRQIKNGKTGQLCWTLETSAKLPQYVDAEECPTETAVIKYVPWCHIGEGKERNFEAARSCAIWPEATDEQLASDDLKTMLENRLPALIEEFKNTINDIGFLWEPIK